MTETPAAPSPAMRLADAFNARDLEAMGALLSPEATAQVLGSEFPVEEGRAAICETSLSYLLHEDQGPLTAEAVRHADAECVLLRRAGAGRPLDSAIRVLSEGPWIHRLEYLVIWFPEGDLVALAAALGVPLAEPESD